MAFLITLIFFHIVSTPQRYHIIYSVLYQLKSAETLLTFIDYMKYLKLI